MSKLREAAQAALTAYGTFRDVDDIDGLDDAMDRLSAAIEQHVAEAVAREREECAKVCDALNFVDTGTSPIGTRASNRHCAAAIRARAEMASSLLHRISNIEEPEPMSELREAAQAALTAYEKFRDADDIDGLDDAMDRLRAALAKPETEAEPVVEPVAWEARWNDPEEGASYWVPTQNPDFYRSRPNYEVRPLYAHPPRDEWRPASEPPEDLRRRVIAWRSPPQRQSGTWVEALYDDGAWVTRDGIAHDITHWRDIEPPTEGAK